jgi:UDP-N-acetylmuramate: L-alanyl-gamma-D-glutamyl-meso-diaminopimelate ligase
MSKERVHILGICGTFMGGLALLGKEQGLEISGCDLNIYPPMSDHLHEMGIDISEGYDPSKLPEADCYVIGNSISRGNPALEFLLSKKANLISGPDWLYKTVLKNKRVIAVSGTHGKTTTTAMIAWIFEDHNIDVGYLIAGKPKDFEKSARLGEQDIFVIEADEYDTAFFDKRSKFIHYKPDTLIINNLEFDHGDIFPDLSFIFREFHHLIRILNEEAQIIFPTDDLNIAKVLNMGCWSKLISYGVDGNHENAISLKDPTNITFTIKDETGDLDWDMYGEHNARNAMAAALAVNQYGISLESALVSLRNFSGVSKRQDILINSERLLLIEDFAHHPTAIKTTLEGIKQKYPTRRLVAVIELRSNTMKSGYHDDHLIESVSLADEVFWKSEDFEQVEGLVSKKKSNSKQIINVDSFIEDFDSISSPGDIFIIMSNGNFDDISKKIIKKIND